MDFATLRWMSALCASMQRAKAGERGRCPADDIERGCDGDGAVAVRRNRRKRLTQIGEIPHQAVEHGR